MRRGCRLCREDLPLTAFGVQAAVCTPCRRIVRLYKRYGTNVDAVLENKATLARMRIADEERRETKFKDQLARYRKIVNRMAQE